MDRKTLQLLLVLITVSQAQDLLVSQASCVQGVEGGSVTLHCSYNASSEPKLGSYEWVKDKGVVIKHTSQDFKGRVNGTSDQGFLLRRRADLTIRDLRLSDTGMYQCVVNIFGFQEASGKGTELRVVKKVLMVFQPSSAQGTEGGSVTLHCSYNYTSIPKIGSYQWVKDSNLTVKNMTQEFLGRVSLTSDEGFLFERKADIMLQDLKHSDSGTYRCVVNIHGLQETSGRGTKLLVLKEVPKSAGKGNRTHSATLLVPLAAGFVSVLVISVAAPLIFLSCKRKQGCRAKTSTTECPSQGQEASEVLNYVAVTVKREASMLQHEELTHVSMDRHGN